MIQFGKTMIVISMMCYTVSASNNSIPAKYCIMKNCYNCQRILTHGYPSQVHLNVCKVMLTQKNCCEFFTLQSRGILFWKLKNIINCLLHIFIYFCNFIVQNQKGTYILSKSNILHKLHIIWQGHSLEYNSNLVCFAIDSKNHGPEKNKNRDYLK